MDTKWKSTIKKMCIRDRHTAWYSVEAQAVLQSTPAEEVVRVLNGEVPLNVVNKDILKK